ncbi:putative SWI/SNF-related matrix-associated actin-dependent regulator of chromatin subfamily A member 3-like 1 [Iris pallida]|uniref:SWI/SNF-related matrix-associated actin-dependent regulator of chromatin subfamily A member 3-like 1 n=1 Tax=Iris pallida TaxID=29817 RepID=A0AAX6E0S9_IRIPA|nr:putative SWI/SNF-related matrix-associated actin-dependent regulator of chromatin subfamily A member 3-like 1 [Iris pallida]
MSSDSDDQSTQSSQSLLSESCLVGFVIANIVGLRHYTGRVSGRELVGLVREPLNPYDPNALKVLNTRHAQVGHIERSAAAAVSPLLDSGLVSNLEAIVPKPPKNHNPFRLPCQLHLFAHPSSFPAVQSAIATAGLTLIHPLHPEFPLSDSVIVQERSTKNSRTLDEIFALVCGDGKKKEEIVAMEPDKNVVVSELFMHQKEGLGWMAGRENSADLPPFWEEKRKGLFLNVLTNFETDERPEPLRGGILADDMGLGKTLMLLSLIATNSNRKKVGNVRKKRKTDDGGPCNATLVVCPSSVLATWVAQLEEHTRPGSLKTYLYHGAERTKKSEELAKHDIVLTTYNTLALDFTSSGADCPVARMKWLRVVLDEAHVIKNAAAQQAKAVAALEAERRWVVTGTPIQNSLGDLFALMAFLRFQPFSIKSYWQSLVQRPVAQGSKSGLSRLQALIGSISLRRLKDMQNDSKSLIELPLKVVETCFVELSSEEREYYDQMESEAKNTVREYIDSERVMRNYSTILYFILRLRQICNDVALCPSDIKSLLSSTSLEDVSTNPELLRKLGSMIEDGDDFDCPVCLSPPTKTIITSCSHIFCESCILKTLKRLKPCCPICRHTLSQSDLFSAPQPKPSDDEESARVSTQGPISSKVSVLLKFLQASRKQNPSTKSVVFSQFRKMLILLEEPLRAAGFVVLRLDGAMTVKKRTEVMKGFGKVGPDAPTVLLASLKAAGAGINLTAASRVYLVEPWWNPAIEEQAMDRVHRIGQREEVRVVRLVVKDSVEERILALQEKKKKLAGGVFGRKAAKEQRETRVEDLRTMMGL